MSTPETPSESRALARPIAAAKQTAIGFTAGFKHLIKGLRFVYVDHGRQLARYYLPPMFLGLTIFGAGFVLLWFTEEAVVDWAVNWIWSEPGEDSWTITHVLWGVFNVVVGALVWLIYVALTLVTAVVLFMLVATVFNDLISERVEGILGTWEPRRFDIRFLLRDLGHTLALELARLWIKVRLLLPLLILTYFIPVVGQAVYVVVGGYFLAKYLGMDYVDWALARRGYRWRDRFAFAKQHKWALVGFGTAVVIALVIPLGFVAAWPGAVAGGTMLCITLGPEDRRVERSADAVKVVVVDGDDR
jgi:CysZ protein